MWRRLHPDEDNQFTVWDEYTSARLSNEVSSLSAVTANGQGCSVGSAHGSTLSISPVEMTLATTA